MGGYQWQQGVSRRSGTALPLYLMKMMATLSPLRRVLHSAKALR